MTVEFVYKDRQTGNLYYIEAQAFDPAATEIEAQAVDDKGEATLVTVRMLREIKRRLLKAIDNAHYIGNDCE